MVLVKASEERTVVIYSCEDGMEPFSEWIEGLKDITGRKRILTRVERLAGGNFGDCEPIGDGLKELRMFFGSGYRVYFGEHRGNIVILLCGGDKNTQNRDIKNAKQYWKEYLSYEKI